MGFSRVCKCGATAEYEGDAGTEALVTYGWVLQEGDLDICPGCASTETSLDERIQGAVSDAEAIFWEGLKTYFPEAKTATLDPTTVMVLSVAMENAVRDWVWLNVTKEGA